MLAFFWLQREEDILGRLTWNHYRPASAPMTVQIFHHKTGEQVDLPLYDEDGTALWPELMARLDAAPRRGNLRSPPLADARQLLACQHIEATRTPNGVEVNGARRVIFNASNHRSAIATN